MLDAREAPASSTGDMIKLYRSGGAFVCRSLFSPSEVNTLRCISRTCYAMGEAIADNMPPADVPHDIADGIMVRGYVSWPRMKACLTCVGVDASERLSRIVEKTERIASTICDGRAVRFLEGFSIARRHSKNPRPSEITRVPWHRDSTFIGMAGFHNTLNFWAPLTEVGITAPSIELMIGSNEYMRTVPEDNPGITDIPAKWVDKHLAGFQRWTPRCGPGDALFFDDHTIHRTQQMEATATDRINFEFRWAPA